ncbi:MAG TPA: radical SAM family heme chaperone HemW [Mycobacteriales bacterium]|nr:radical SAM family heme chaperone HemW [Mycobacteriales bacterium]
MAALGSAPFGVYVHVPFCATRCGYCDFNTYTATELGSGASAAQYAETVIGELALARRVLGDVDLPARTVFFGGGTPTLLPPEDLVRVLRSIAETFGLAADAEVSTEANPESVSPATLSALRAGGVNRISFGMQSAVPHVLATLDRTHTPGRARQAVDQARAAGFDRVSLDLIYGTPGESDEDWRTSVRAALDAGVDHVSAYSLIVEPGTRLAGRVARGELPMPDDDVLADRYAIADEMFAAAGLGWYEVSNWARAERDQVRHNLLYWTSGDWWGAGPGAHSHVGGVRWWNVKHPRDYAARLADGVSPAAAREVLSDADRALEDVMLRLRLRSGMAVGALASRCREPLERAVGDGLLDPTAYADGRAVLTLRGRLLGDAVIRSLVG